MQPKILALSALLLLSGTAFPEAITHSTVSSQFNGWKAYGSTNLAAGTNIFLSISAGLGPVPTTVVTIAVATAPMAATACVFNGTCE